MSQLSDYYGEGSTLPAHVRDKLTAPARYWASTPPHMKENEKGCCCISELFWNALASTTCCGVCSFIPCAWLHLILMSPMLCYSAYSVVPGLSSQVLVITETDFVIYAKESTRTIPLSSSDMDRIHYDDGSGWMIPSCWLCCLSKIPILMINQSPTQRTPNTPPAPPDHKFEIAFGIPKEFYKNLLDCRNEAIGVSPTPSLAADTSSIVEPSTPISSSPLIVSSVLSSNKVYPTPMEMDRSTGTADNNAEVQSDVIILDAVVVQSEEDASGGNVENDQSDGVVINSVVIQP